MVFLEETYPAKRPIRCTCQRWVNKDGEDVRWSLCAWHEDKAQWAARETHRHDPAVCRVCAAQLEAEGAADLRPLDDIGVAEHLAVAIVMAGNPSRYKNAGEHAKAIVAALRKYESRETK